MLLAALIDTSEDALRADLQRYYGIDLDHAMAGEHSAGHVAALAAYLPSDAATHIMNDGDAVWTLEATLTAALLNTLNALAYGMSDKAKRGSRPQMVGPSRMRGGRKALAKPMTTEQLMAELSKPRREQWLTARK